MTKESMQDGTAYPKLAESAVFLYVHSCHCYLFSVVDINVIFEPPYLLPITNTIFTAIIPLVVALNYSKDFPEGTVP